MRERKYNEKSTVSLSVEDQRYYADLKGVHRFIGAHQGLLQVLQATRASQDPNAEYFRCIAAPGERSEMIPRMAIAVADPINGNYYLTPIVRFPIDLATFVMNALLTGFTRPRSLDKS